MMKEVGLHEGDQKDRNKSIETQLEEKNGGRQRDKRRV